MKQDEILTVIGEINESQRVLTQIHKLYLSYQAAFTDIEARDLRDAVLLAELMCNTYTCIETVFLRISRLFENSLDPQQWHKELLQKMRLEIPRIRQAVLSPQSYQLLDELRRFRHFRRYYYDFDYDWSRLDYLRGIYEKLFPLIQQQLNDYSVFLDQLAAPDFEP